MNRQKVFCKNEETRVDYKIVHNKNAILYIGISIFSTSLFWYLGFLRLLFLNIEKVGKEVYENPLLNNDLQGNEY